MKNNKSTLLKAIKGLVFMTEDQFKFNKSMLKYDEFNWYTTNNGEAIVVVTSPDNKYFLDMARVNEVFWQAIRMDQSLFDQSIDPIKKKELEEDTARLYSLHQSLLPLYEHGIDFGEINFSRLLCEGEGLTVLASIIDDEELYKNLLDSSRKKETQLGSCNWLTIGQGSTSKELLAKFFEAGTGFLKQDLLTTTRGYYREQSLLKDLLPSYVFMAHFNGIHEKDITSYVNEKLSPYPIDDELIEKINQMFSV